MFFFILTDVAAHLHASVKHLQEFVVQRVDLLTQKGEIFCGSVFGAEHESINYKVKHLGGDLLAFVREGTVGVTVALDDEAVKAHVHSLLREGSYQLAFAADVAGIADDREVGIAPAQLDGDAPLGHVAV